MTTQNTIISFLKLGTFSEIILHSPCFYQSAMLDVRKTWEQSEHFINIESTKYHYIPLQYQENYSPWLQWKLARTKSILQKKINTLVIQRNQEASGFRLKSKKA